MEPLIHLIVYLILFAIIAYGLYWVCVKFTLPQPVLWICGAILLIVIFAFLSQELGLKDGGNWIPPLRK